MKLTKVEVTNFRSAEDSGEFEVGQVTCLVGKNEAGKTAIEQALTGLNPHPLTRATYDKERDYPRRWLTEYDERTGDDEAVVVTTKWELSAEERAALAEIVGESAMTGNEVNLSRLRSQGTKMDVPY